MAQRLLLLRCFKTFFNLTADAKDFDGPPEAFQVSHSKQTVLQVASL